MFDTRPWGDCPRCKDGTPAFVDKLDNPPVRIVCHHGHSVYFEQLPGGMDKGLPTVSDELIKEGYYSPIKREITRRRKLEFKRVGKIIREARVKKGLSMAEVARAISVSYTCMLDYERGDHGPTLENCRKLSEFLNIPIIKIKPKTRNELWKEIEGKEAA